MPQLTGLFHLHAVPGGRMFSMPFGGPALVDVNSLLEQVSSVSTFYGELDTAIKHSMMRPSENFRGAIYFHDRKKIGAYTGLVGLNYAIIEHGKAFKISHKPHDYENPEYVFFTEKGKPIVVPKEQVSKEVNEFRIFLSRMFLAFDYIPAE